jgi:hypothetical protein
MEKVIYDLRQSNELRAATWLERHWTGDRGRFSQGHAGYGCPNNNNGQESGWGRMKKKIPSDCPYYVFISAWQQYTAGKCKDEQSATASACGSHCPFLPNEPVVTRELWNNVRKLTVLDVRKWCEITNNEEWTNNLSDIENFMSENKHCSLARALITRNSTGDPVCDKRFVRNVIIPTSKFLDLLGKGYNFIEGVESCVQRNLYKSFMCGTKTDMVGVMESTRVENILNNTQYFYSASILNTGWGNGAQWCCTCKPCYKNGICEHSFPIPQSKCLTD